MCFETASPRVGRFPWTKSELRRRVSAAVRSYWEARSGQLQRQKEIGTTDGGMRGEVTSGQHLNAFVHLLCEIAEAAGFNASDVRFRSGIELPGYYRPQKKWDIVVVRDQRLYAAIEMKSQVGPSFGNNFNNRSEEAIGSSVDFWVAFREGIMGIHPPWVGYFLLVEESPGSMSPVKLAKSLFAPMPIFQQTSYIQRYGILCQRLVLERNYNAASLLVTPRGTEGHYAEPFSGLGFSEFVHAFFGHLVGSS